MRRWLALCTALFTVCASACDGCAGCGKSDGLATLERAEGVVEADAAEAPVTFEAAARGREFRLGDAVRTAADARADLALAGGGTLHVEPRSVVRFSATPGAARRVGIGVEVGGAEVEAPADDALAFTTAFGNARVERGSRVRVSGGEDARFEVVMGSALVDGDGGSVTLSVGDRFVIQVGGAVLERGSAQRRDAGRPRALIVDAGAPSDLSALITDSGAADASDAPGTDDGAGSASVPEDTAAADFSIAAGETATIHDPSAPTAVRFRFGAGCTTGGTVELARTGSSFSRALRASGRTSATLTVPNGAHAYRVRCGGGAPFASGTVRVSRDAGTATLPRRAPRTTVDADGRRYTVLYQTLLPIITLRWRRAPEAPNYIISVERAGGRAEETTSRVADHTFAAGHFGDGSYTFTFRTADGRVRTAPTSMRIDFDNATPAAHLDAPSARAQVAGGVTVSGTAGEGAAVSVGGRALDTDRSGRFSGQASPAGGERCIALRVAHPQRGVHYYLRCGGA